MNTQTDCGNQYGKSKKPIHPCDGEKNTKQPCLCIARSVASEEIVDGGSVQVMVPANSCITKIYASGEALGDTRLLHILIEGFTIGETYFIHRSPARPEGDFAVFETTLVQPLCVGEVDSLVRARFVRLGELFSGTLTVVYCENCCPPTAL